MRGLIVALVLLFASVVQAQDNTLVQRGVRGFSQTVVSEYPDSWYTHGTATAATASATRAATTGSAHYVTKIVARCDSGSATPTVRLLEGVNVVIQFTAAAVEMIDISFPVPFRAPDSTLVTADIGSCGAGVVGRVTIMGYTLEAD